jgi:exonuclease VII small subunit
MTVRLSKADKEYAKEVQSFRKAQKALERADKRIAKAYKKRYPEDKFPYKLPKR